MTEKNSLICSYLIAKLIVKLKSMTLRPFQ